MSNTELKIVVDVSKPLKEVGAVSALLAVYNAAWDVVRDLVMQPLTCDDPVGGRMFTLNTDLHEKLRQAFMDAGELGAIDQILNRLPSIVGAETQVGQFVTASPAYGVYHGEHIGCDACGDTGKVADTEGDVWPCYRQHAQEDFQPESVAAAHPQGFKAAQRAVVKLLQDTAWGQFLAARRRLIFEFFNDGKSYVEIARTVSSDAAQIQRIHEHPMSVQAQADEALIDANVRALKTVGVPEKMDVERSFFRRIVDEYLTNIDTVDANLTANDIVADICEIIRKSTVKPARVTATGQSALEGIMSAMDRANADDMLDAARYRTLLRCLEIDSDMSEKGYKPSDGEVEAMRRLFADKFTTKETANAAIDGIISEKLLGEHQ